MATAPTVSLVVGERVLDLTRHAKNLTWTTQALGGFGSCSFTLEGVWTREKIPYLAFLRVTAGHLVLFEGRVEDLTFSFGEGESSTTVTAFGLQRLLDDAKIRFSWGRRDAGIGARFVKTSGVDGTTQIYNTGGLIYTLRQAPAAFTFGGVDPADQSKNGLRHQGNGGTLAFREATGAEILFGGCSQEYALQTVCFSRDSAGSWPANFTSYLQTMYSGDALATTTIGHALAFNNNSACGLTSDPTKFCNGLRIGWLNDNAVTATVAADWYFALYQFVLIFGPQKGGPFYTPPVWDTVSQGQISLYALADSVQTAVDGITFPAHQILADVLSFVPGLSRGFIDKGKEFTVNIDAATRRAARTIIEELSSYYLKEWGVWEDARLDWRAANYDEPDFVLSLAECSSLRVDTSLEDWGSDFYVAYSEPFNSDPASATAKSGDARNPLVQSGTKRGIVREPGFVMTANTASQLASRLAQALGGVSSRAEITLPFDHPVQSTKEGKLPAYAIRAGQNVVVPDLGTYMPASEGRDGQTLFHIASTEASADGGTVKLSGDAMTKDLDVLLARLGFVTRNLIG